MRVRAQDQHLVTHPRTATTASRSTRPSLRERAAQQTERHIDVRVLSNPPTHRGEEGGRGTGAGTQGHTSASEKQDRQAPVQHDADAGAEAAGGEVEARVGVSQ